MDRRAEVRSFLLFGLLLGLGTAACGSQGTSTAGPGGAAGSRKVGQGYGSNSISWRG